MTETAAKYATTAPPSFQKLVDMLRESVVRPKFTGEVRIFFSDGGPTDAIKITKRQRGGGVKNFTHEPL